jgi:hypothetical protein
MRLDHLIDLLLDKSSEFGDRDDAAIELSAFDEAEAEDTLAKVASDPASDARLVERCGEALAEIWMRKNTVDHATWNQLRPEARDISRAVIAARRPELIRDLIVKNSAIS